MSSWGYSGSSERVLRREWEVNAWLGGSLASGVPCTQSWLKFRCGCTHAGCSKATEWSGLRKPSSSFMQCHGRAYIASLIHAHALLLWSGARVLSDNQGPELHSHAENNSRAVEHAQLGSALHKQLQEQGTPQGQQGDQAGLHHLAVVALRTLLSAAGSGLNLASLRPEEPDMRSA